MFHQYCPLLSSSTISPHNRLLTHQYVVLSTYQHYISWYFTLCGSYWHEHSVRVNFVALLLISAEESEVCVAPDAKQGGKRKQQRDARWKNVDAIAVVEKIKSLHQDDRERENASVQHTNKSKSYYHIFSLQIIIQTCICQVSSGTTTHEGCHRWLQKATSTLE